MAFSSDLVTQGSVPTGTSGSAITFALTSYQGTGKSVRMDTTSAPATPHTLEFSHRTEGGATKRFIRTATVRQIKLNASTGKPVEGSATLTIRVPDDSTISQADVTAMMNRIANTLIADATNCGRFYRGEV